MADEHDAREAADNFILGYVKEKEILGTGEGTTMVMTLPKIEASLLCSKCHTTLKFAFVQVDDRAKWVIFVEPHRCRKKKRWGKDD